MLGKVYGVDGLKTGGGGGGAGGGGGGTNCCACAWLSAPARRAIQPATKHLEKALRPNLANGISVFFKSPRAPKENVGILSPALVRPPRPTRISWITSNTRTPSSFGIGASVNFGLGRFAPIYVGPPSFAGLAPGGRVGVRC
jgi:hypothetical protein